MREDIVKRIEENISVKKNILNDTHLIDTIERAATVVVTAIKNGNKVIFCGNGGSAADSQHLAAELIGKFYFNRRSLPAVSLTVNTSMITAIGNDFGFNKVFARQLEGIGKAGDVLIGLSTSGNSENVVEAFRLAKEIGISTIAFTGESGGILRNLADILINVPSNDTPRIQEAHIMVGHIICELVEKEFVVNSR